MDAAKKKRLRLKEGDIFTIPIDENTQGHGQIVKIPDKHSFIMVVFEGRSNKNEPVTLDVIVQAPILFIGFTTDALLWHGRWIIIGNISGNLELIVIPYYFRIGLPTEPQQLINYKVEILRMATEQESKLLYRHHSMSPIGYQKMLQAHYGIGDLDKEDIAYDYKHIIDVYTKLNLPLHH